MAKKSSSFKSVNEKNAKAVVSLMVLALALGVYFLFQTYQENLLSSVNFQLFALLIVVLFGLMAVLLFLLNKPSRN